MAVSFPIPSYFTAIFIISRLMSIMGISKHLNNKLLPPLDNITDKLSLDPSAIESASQDFGHIVKSIPKAVLQPSSIADIASLINFSYNSSIPFTIAAKGHGHSVRGQAMANDGVVVDMTSMKKHRNGTGIWVSNDGVYADVGGEQLWIDVLNATLKHGVAPVSWTDYLYLTVGGTLSNGGISGQSFRYGPQISNVYEMDVITGKAEIVTCSPNKNSELFHAALGGLGQFGIITRARIPLEPAPKRELEQLLKGLSYMPGFMFEKDVLYAEFLNRVQRGELKARSQGLWDVPHPWLNLFIPKSQIQRFNDGVFKGIVLERNITTGPVLVYPMNRKKWDDRMSAVIPDEEIFYTVGFLHSSGFDDREAFDDQNKEILKFCEEAGIGVKQYLPHFTSKDEWVHHFGSKWETFQQRKFQFDPKMILSPGQRIFNNN
ncbi:hypothetical protein ES319_A07G013100v1 [Gossypium barbadense]|uniref:cytokinin dehydrogenase n=1 Tax=Gossypium barbadense TaxID=3634 RepID=A0A5J5UY48_GOSBA|nr:hypothetical protein ES319_A07G013100v1 [Gossypium barbadense]